MKYLIAYLLNIALVFIASFYLVNRIAGKKGLIPDSEKRRYHTIGLHKPIAHLNAVIRPDFIVVDHISDKPVRDKDADEILKAVEFYEGLK